MNIQKRLQIEFEFLGEEQISANTALKIINDVFKEAEAEQLILNGVSRSLPSDYDIGLISDYGGGNVEWWQDYLREEVARCNNYWVSQLQNED